MHEDSCTYIPFEPSEVQDDREDARERARLDAYKMVWARALGRIQDISERLQESIISSVTRQVDAAYSDSLPALPYTELPTIVVNGDSSLFSIIVHRMKALPDEDELPSAYVTQLHPAECNNIMNTMKSMVTGFLSYEEGNSKRRTAASLANYDINLLRVWAEHAARSNRDRVIPSLVVAIHNFEQFDAEVLQSLFHICSRHISRLPFVFLLSTLSPVPANFLQSTYRRDTLSLLRISYLSSSSNSTIVEDILSSVFFDPAWEPSVMIGPSALSYIVNYTTRYHASTDALATILQLAHMKHFTRPLALFAGREEVEPDEELLHVLLVRTQALSAARGTSWANASSTQLLDTVDAARTNFGQRATRAREAYAMAWAVYGWFFSHGYKVLEDGGWRDAHPRLTLMRKILECTLVRDVKYWGMMIGKLDAEKLADLVPLLREQIHTSSTAGNEAESDEAILRDIEEELSNLAVSAALVDEPSVARPGRNPRIVELAEQVRTLFLAHMNPRLDPLDSDAVPLWDIWYMGGTPFPTELLNPAPRAAVLGALSHPHLYARAASTVQNKREQDVGRVKLADLPDTAIAFRRYLDAGKMVNVHDWFESFKLVLDAQRPNDVREDDEAWLLEVQARFMRSLHELDWVGLIKHTNRKPDHVIKTVWELPE